MRADVKAQLERHLKIRVFIVLLIVLSLGKQGRYPCRAEQESQNS